MVGGRTNCDEKRDTSQCLPSFKRDLCNRIKPAQVSSNVLENVLDIASTLVDILQMCGVHECKANRALDVIIYAFMHFDEVAEHPGGKCKKRIRKEEFNNDLTRDCGMTKADMKLTYSIVKCAFKAFYHKQVLQNYNMALVDECVWRSAANKTVSAFAHSGASKSQIELTGRRILSAYENFICRLQARSSRKGGAANPCICSSGRPNVPQYRPCRHDSDPCKPEYLQPCQPPDPPLCAQLQCQFVCPPGATYPQIICKDPCGRLFLKVDGDLICFDPLILECEARRAAMDICPPSNAERIKALRECIKPCMPKDTDSCDEKLAEIGFDDIEYEADYEQFKKDIERTDSEVSDEEVVLDDLEGQHEKVLTKRDHKTKPEENEEKEKEGEEKEGEEKEGEEKDEENEEKEIKNDDMRHEDKNEEDKEDEEEEEHEEEEVGTAFFISADLKTLENGKRKLDVKIRGKCRKSEKIINILNGLHVEGSHQEEMWYELTPTSGPAIQKKDASKVPSQASQAISNSKSKQSQIEESQVVDENKPDVDESANKDEDIVQQNEQGSGEPADESSENKVSNIDEPPANENAGDQLSEVPEAAN